MDKRSEKLYNCMRNYIKCLDDRNMKTDNYVQVVREASLAEAYKINNDVLRASIDAWEKTTTWARCCKFIKFR